MNDKNDTGLIPEQESGFSVKAEKSITLDTEEAARTFFQTVKQRLLNVNTWHNLAGEFLADFQLTDMQGHSIEGEAKEGFYFKIDIPGPGTKTGKGYDWVQIEKIEEMSKPDIERLGIRVRPARSPLENNSDIAHFYTAEATSSFTVTREGRKITAGIYDRNIKPNVKAQDVADKVRDVMIGSAGIVVFSKLQWDNLVDGLLKQNAKA